MPGGVGHFVKGGHLERFHVLELSRSRKNDPVFGRAVICLVLHLQFYGTEPFLFLYHFIQPRVPVSFYVVRYGRTGESDPHVLIPLRIFFLEIRLIYVEYIEMFHEGSHLIFLLLKFREAFVIIEADFFPRRLMLHGDIVKSHGKGVRSFYDHQVLILQLTEGHEYREGVSHPVHLYVEHKTVHAVVRTP